MHKGVTAMMEAAGMRGHKTEDHNTSDKKNKQLFQKRHGGGHCVSSEEISSGCQRMLSSLCVRVCVMRVCVMHVWRKLWQLSRVNVSCCSAVQANVRPVIDVSLC